MLSLIFCDAYIASSVFFFSYCNKYSFKVTTSWNTSFEETIGKYNYLDHEDHQ